jgi:hypothetical protein
MAAIAITAGSVIPSSSAVIKYGVAGETITAGQVLYVEPVTNLMKLCDANSTAAIATAAGIATNGASVNQRVYYCTEDTGGFAIGATILSGDTLWTSATAGGITKTAADNVNPVYATVLGVMTSTTLARIKIVAGGLIA